MTSRRCCHMGADLAQGRVYEETIECPLHGWRFDCRGRCIDIQSLHTVPEAIHIPYLRCEEQYGLIFAFWGETVEFALPRPPGMQPNLVYSRPYIMALPADHHVPCLNTFDIQHFERIHHRRFLAEPNIHSTDPYQLQIDYVAEIVKRRWSDYLMTLVGPAITEVVIDCWGSSLLLLKNQATGIGALVALLPLKKGKSLVFIVAIKESRRDQARIESFVDRMTVAVASLMVRAFLQPDVAAITNMTPFKGTWIDGLDDGAKVYWDYWRQLPRWNGPDFRQKISGA